MSAAERAIKVSDENECVKRSSDRASGRGIGRAISRAIGAVPCKVDFMLILPKVESEAEDGARNRRNFFTDTDPTLGMPPYARKQ